MEIEPIRKRAADRMKDDKKLPGESELAKTVGRAKATNGTKETIAKRWQMSKLL